MGDYLSTKLDADQVMRRAYDETENRLRVDAEVTATIGDIDVHITAASGDNIAIVNQNGTFPLIINPDGSINTNTTITDISLNQADDSIAIGDGIDLIDINVDGSINTQDVYSNYNKLNFFEIINVPSAVSTLIGSYIVPSGKTSFLQQVVVSGTNVATYEIYLNSLIISRKRTIYTELNENFMYAITSNNGYKLIPGDLVEVKVLHNRPWLGDFDTSIQVVEK